MKLKFLLITLILIIFSSGNIVKAQDTNLLSDSMGGCDQGTNYQSGNFKVGTISDSFSNSYGEYPFTVYYPALEDGIMTSSDYTEAPYPIIILAPGIFAQHSYYSWIGNELASHGYIAGLFTSANLLPSVENGIPVDIVAGFNDALEKIKAMNQDSVFANAADTDKSAAIGHSLGSIGAIYAVESNSEFDTGILMSPPNIPGQELAFDLSNIDFENLNIPIHLQIGQNETNLLEGAWIAYSIAYPPKLIVELFGGGHVGFMDEGLEYQVANQLYAYLMGEEISVPHSQLQQVSAKYFVAWLDYFLKGDTLHESLLFGEGLEEDLNDNFLSNYEFAK